MTDPCDTACCWLNTSDVVLDTSAPMHSHHSSILLAWHQLYEELKLNVQEEPHLVDFARLLHFLANIQKASAYVQVYETGKSLGVRDFMGIFRGFKEFYRIIWDTFWDFFGIF